MLCIAFVLCTFGLIYSRFFDYGKYYLVVNCFRSLYLWVDLQPCNIGGTNKIRCELLSFFVPLGWFTAPSLWAKIWQQLWIAFVLCTFGLIYSAVRNLNRSRTVVNCFRSLYLWVDLQRYTEWLYMTLVVNCFRSLYLWVDLQLPPRAACRRGRCELLSFFVPLGWFTALAQTWKEYASCELLSFFVPLGWFTAKCCQWAKRESLWIAFVLCTFGLIYSHNCGHEAWSAVVNCFRSLYLWVDLQLWLQYAGWLFVVNCFRSLYLWVDLQRANDWREAPSRCELLSFFVPLGWFTASVVIDTSAEKLWIAFVLCTFGLIYSELPFSKYPFELWIAFVLCTFGLIYSIVAFYSQIYQVVNCFRSLYLWVDLQPTFWYYFYTFVVNCFRSLYLWVDLQPILCKTVWVRGLWTVTERGNPGLWGLGFHCLSRVCDSVRKVPTAVRPVGEERNPFRWRVPYCRTVCPWCTGFLSFLFWEGYASPLECTHRHVSLRRSTCDTH